MAWKLTQNLVCNEDATAVRLQRTFKPIAVCCSGYSAKRATGTNDKNRFSNVFILMATNVCMELPDLP